MLCCFVLFFFKQKTAYEMRISDWSSDVCSSDLQRDIGLAMQQAEESAQDVFIGEALAENLRRGKQRTGGKGLERLDEAMLVGRGEELLDRPRAGRDLNQIGRAHVLTPVTNAPLVCRLLLEKKKNQHNINCYPQHT